MNKIGVWIAPLSMLPHFYPPHRPLSLCGIEVPRLNLPKIESPPEVRCDRCYVLYLNELTAEAAIVRAALSLPWIDTEAQARRVAEYAAHDRAKLAAQLREMTDRVHALYTAPPVPHYVK